MKPNPSTFSQCAICHSRPADKTNSHLIPSFFIAMVSSIDGSYKRDRELLYTIGEHTTTAYIGRSVKEEDLQDIFETLSDERLVELSKHTDSKDFVFCPHCEKKLGEYLESPWHDHLFRSQRITPDTAYFFWVSILWRISTFEGISLKLPNHIEKALGKRLNSFIKAKDSKEDTKQLLEKAPFKYKVIYCKDYSRSNSGLIYSEYDIKSKIASIVLGDVAACFTFNKHGSFDNHSFYGLEKAFKEAPINDGFSKEVILLISSDVLNSFNKVLIPELQSQRLAVDRENIHELWRMLNTRIGMQLPKKPNELFIQYVISELYNEKVKTGEKITREYFVKCFRKGLECFYGIPINHH